MKGQDDFFSQKHIRLLNLATWAKYLAWVVLIIFALDALAIFLQTQTGYLNGLAGNVNFLTIFKNDPDIAIRILLDVLGVFFKGVVYYLVLKGLSLGLNMIVETDINYRENNNREEKQ